MGLGRCCNATPYPLLRISVQSGPDGPPCFHEHTNIPIPVRIVPENDFATWPVEMAKELAIPIPLNHSPLARITLPRKSGGSTLLLSMHHSIADGLSSAFVIRDILEALSGKPLQPLTLTEPQELRRVQTGVAMGAIRICWH